MTNFHHHTHMGWSGVEDFSSPVNLFHADLQRWDPRKLFAGKQLRGTIYSNRMDFSVWDALLWAEYGEKRTPILDKHNQKYLGPKLTLHFYKGFSIGDKNLGYNKALWTTLRQMPEGPTPPSPRQIYA